jgi:serine/threonine-protein kinase
MQENQVLKERYRLEERLGSGGMAIVYRASDLLLARTVAIKLLRQDFTSDAEMSGRFRQEALAAANLSHPNIVTVHDFGLDNERLFIVMEYVPGTDLKQMVQRRGQLSLDEALPLLIQASAGIGYAHRAGLVHCDVKPQNLLVTPDKRLKVTDFGIARALASILPDEQAEVVWGSPQYFSPEQASGQAPSPASDVYSLGVVMFELLTGQLPFSAPTPEELARLHREMPPPSPRKLNPAIPTALEQIILKVLSKEPSARYRAADQLGRVLLSISKAETSTSPALNLTPEAVHNDPDSSATVASLKPIANGSASASASAAASPAQAAINNAAPAPATDTEPVTPRAPLRPPYPTRRAAEIPSQPLPSAPGQNRPRTYVSPSTFSTPQPARRSPLDIDWVTWGLALMALVFLGGLIPFCLWVYYTIFPPL